HRAQLLIWVPLIKRDRACAECVVLVSRAEIEESLIADTTGRATAGHHVVHARRRGARKGTQREGLAHSGYRERVEQRRPRREVIAPFDRVLVPIIRGPEVVHVREHHDVGYRTGKRREYPVVARGQPGEAAAGIDTVTV